MHHQNLGQIFPPRGEQGSEGSPGKNDAGGKTVKFKGGSAKRRFFRDRVPIVVIRDSPKLRAERE